MRYCGVARSLSPLWLCALLAACGGGGGYVEAKLPPDPSPQAYVTASNGSATLVPAGQYTLDGHRVECSGRPTLLDPGLNDYAATYPKFIIVNPTLMAKVATPVKLWIYAHECGHHHVGKDEAKADCYGIKRGRREGWLDAKGLGQICAFIQPGRADSAHFSGPERCAAMRQCYEAANH
jgi:hypothetical protein